MASRDSDAIEAILNGDVDRFAELVDAYQAQAIRIAFTFLGNAEEARDAAQEAFIRAYRALGSFHQKSQFSTWFYRIVINVCKDSSRRRMRQPMVVARVGPVDAVEEGISFGNYTLTTSKQSVTLFSQQGGSRWNASQLKTSMRSTQVTMLALKRSLRTDTVRYAFALAVSRRAVFIG